MMKKRENDSTATLERFGRDKRQRSVTATAERIERRPRQPREAADADYRPSNEERRSYNPHFTADNRPKFDRPRREFGDRPRFENNRFGGGDERRERPAYGEKPRYNRNNNEHGDRKPYGERPAYGAKREGGFGGDNPRYNRYNDTEKRPYEERSERGPKRFGDRPAYGEHGPKREGGFGGDKPRTYGDRPAYGERGPKRFGGKPGYKRNEERTHSYPKYNPEKQTGEMRLNRFLAQSGICSRREADDFIVAGLVTVNGVIVTELGTKVMPTDEVKFNDSRIEGEKRVYLVLNKPKGYVTSLEDPHADKTVMELVKDACTERIYPVGRLDKNSVGLLLFTNDGDLTKQLTHPSYRKKKIYQVSLDKPLTRADMDRIAEGITLEDGEIYADEISYVKENKQEVGIEIHSGRNRIVRRIFEFLGYTVTKLDRVYYAGLTKKNLKRGAWRFLSREEVERLKSGQYE